VSARQDRLLLAVADRLDAFTRGVGRAAACFTIATVLICFATVYLRYAVGVGYVWLQESYVWTHVVAIMFGSSFALLQGGFVRVDPMYNRMSDRGRAMVDLFGTVAFMGPFLWMMGVSGWSFFFSSFQMKERSAYDSGLPAMYVLKGTLLVFVALVALQGVSIVLRSVLTLLGHGSRAPSAAPAEAL
jgi:TRAP-type mannitol/chloroaromatic compound transport system permease small subunit